MQQTTLIEQREKIIISIDAEKAPDKAENPFMIKNIQPTRNSRSWSVFFSYNQFRHHLPAGNGRPHTLRAQFYKLSQFWWGGWT